MLWQVLCGTASALIGRTGQSVGSRVHRRVLWWAASWPEKSFAEAVLKLQRVALGTRREWGVYVNGQDKKSNAEVSCGPGIVLAFQSFFGVCSVGFRGGERCDRVEMIWQAHVRRDRRAVLEASSLAGRRCLRGDDSLEVKAAAEMERRQEYEASHLEWMGRCFQSKEF